MIWIKDCRNNLLLLWFVKLSIRTHTCVSKDEAISSKLTSLLGCTVAVVFWHERKIWFLAYVLVFKKALNLVLQLHSFAQQMNAVLTSWIHTTVNIILSQSTDWHPELYASETSLTSLELYLSSQLIDKCFAWSKSHPNWVCVGNPLCRFQLEKRNE